MRRASKVLIAVLLSMLLATESYAATQTGPKAGITCLKAGAKASAGNAKFICTKVGKKLLWVKANKKNQTPTPPVPSPTTTSPVPLPTPTPTPTPSYYIPPLPTSANPITFANIANRIQDIPQAFYNTLQETKERNANLPGARVQVNVVRSPQIFGTNYDNTEKWIKEEVTALANFARFKKVYIFEYSYDDIEWAQGQFNSILNDGSYKLASIYGGKSCAEANRHDAPMQANITNGWDKVIDQSKPFEVEIPFVLAGYCEDSTFAKWAQMSGTAHELNHQYQIVQFWDYSSNFFPNFVAKAPCWTVEGQAVALGGMAFETNYPQFLADYTNIPRPYYLNSAMSSYQIAPVHWSPVDVQKYLEDSSNILPGCRSTNRFALSYSLGAFTTIALSAIGGWESTYSLLPMLNDGISLNDAFKNVYGITWDAALPTLAQVVSQMQMQVLDPPSAEKYVAKDSNNIVTLKGTEGCSRYEPDDPQTIQARIQVLQDGKWLDAPSVDVTWAQDSACNFNPALAWMVTIKVALDHGSQYRFLYSGDVNIGSRDEFGRGTSHTYTYL